MNRKQRNLVKNAFIIVLMTFLFVAAMVGYKNHINKSEAMRAMNQLSKNIMEYRKEYKSLPNSSFVETLLGRELSPRLGNVTYRAQWVSYDSSDQTIIAYVKKNYGLLGKGAILMRLDGTVEWMECRPFEELLKSQQSEVEAGLLEMQMNK